MLSVPVAEGTVLAGKYRVEQVLGRGGMGVVLSAWHLELDQRVALKFLSADLAENTDAAERFRREARAVARIKSEHVVRVLDVGMMDDSTPYMVMEYLDGRDLDDEVEERGVLPISDAVDYTLQAIEAIAEAHAAGIVHRDLKPGNLFLFQRRDGTRMIKVLDFGISKSLPSAESANQLVLTATASLIGSPLYMSPEQMQSPRGVDQRTDIWSLGAILYYSLTGRPPYPAENIAQLCSLLMNTVPTPISQLRAEVPADLERIIGRCLERDRERRFADVSELASALSEFASVLSHVHVSRAARILSVPGVEREVKTLNSQSERDTVVEAAGTQSAWQNDSQKGKGASRRWMVPAALVIAGVAAGLFAWWRAADDAPLASDVAELPKSVPGPPQAAEPKPPEPIVPAPTTPAAAPVAVTAAPVVSAQETSAPARHAAVPPKPVVVPFQKPKVPPAPSAQAKPAPPSNAPAGLTDFGGRR